MSVRPALEAELKVLTGVAELIPLSGGRTNQVWRAGDQVLKVFDQKAASPLFPNSAQDEWTVLNILSDTVLSPKPLSQFETQFGPGISYTHVEGRTGWSDIEETARFLGRIHRVAPPGSLTKRDASDVLAEGSDMIPKGHWLSKLKPDTPDQGPVSLVHRDPVFTNFVSTSHGLRLVDWQCPAIGDPVEDIAHFLSPAMNLLYGGRVLESDEIAAFLQAYPDPSVCNRYAKSGAAYHWRMACFAAWKVAYGDAAYEPPLEAEADLLRRKSTGWDRATVLAQ